MYAFKLMKSTLKRLLDKGVGHLAQRDQRDRVIYKTTAEDTFANTQTNTPCSRTFVCETRPTWGRCSRTGGVRERSGTCLFASRFRNTLVGSTSVVA